MDEKDYDTRGSHYLVDLWGVDHFLLNDIFKLFNILSDACVASGASVVDYTMKKFQPSGCTILLLLEESHCSIHTYPAKGYASVDIYTCGEADPKIGVDYIHDMLNPSSIRVKHEIRGEKPNWSDPYYVETESKM